MHVYVDRPYPFKHALEFAVIPYIAWINIEISRYFIWSVRYFIWSVRFICPEYLIINIVTLLFSNIITLILKNNMSTMLFVNYWTLWPVNRYLNLWRWSLAELIVPSTLFHLHLIYPKPTVSNFINTLNVLIISPTFNIKTIPSLIQPCSISFLRCCFERCLHHCLPPPPLKRAVSV